MKAIEIRSKTDKFGHLRIDYQLDKSEHDVRILILMDEDTSGYKSEQEEEKLWMQSIAKNPAFDFLKEPSEDTYSLKDGEPFHD